MSGLNLVSNFFLGAVSKALASNKDRVGIDENNGPSDKIGFYPFQAK